MDLERSVTLHASRDDVFALVDDLDDYPAWMPLVHRAVATPDAAAWNVELRAEIGPFARSKRLRMVRTRFEPPHRVRFERAEVDGRDHAVWRLEAVVLDDADDTPRDDVRDGGEVELVMRLHYGGRLWTGGLLERALEDQIERGRAGLRRLLEST